MSNLNRRTFLTALSGTTAVLSGCQRFQSASAGSLVVENRHGLPHIVTIDVVSYSPDGETKLGNETGQVVVEPSETKRFPNYFDFSTSYEVTATMPNAETIRVPYGLEGVRMEGNLVFFEVTESGTLNGGLRAV